MDIIQDSLAQDLICVHDIRIRVFAGACVSVTLLGPTDGMFCGKWGPTESEWAVSWGRGMTSLNCYIGPSLSL